MVASDVLVASRRFDAGRDTVTQIKFPHGLSLRPLVAFGPPPELSYETSTLVRIRLGPEYGDPGMVLINKGRPGYEAEAKLPLSQCLSILCACLDVTVEFVDQLKNTTIVHRPIIELDTTSKRKDWLLNLAAPRVGTVEGEILSEHAERLRPIMKDGRVFGMAALSIASAPSRNEFGSVTSVGGLAAGISGSDLARFVGVIDYLPNSAKRDASPEPTAGLRALEIWAAEQKTLLPDVTTAPMAWCLATCSLSDLQLDPIDIATVLVRQLDNYKVLSIDALLDLILTEGLAFYQSPMMRHVDTHHSQGSFNNIPTFWPVRNSSFLSLERDDQGIPPITSILSCIERRALERGIKFIANYASETRASHFGIMPVLVLHGEHSPV